MSRKDYILIARCVSDTLSALGQTDSIECLAVHLAEDLGREDTLFNRVKFLKACGLKKEVEFNHLYIGKKEVEKWDCLK